MGQILLVRHCQSSGQEPDASLTALGFAQAEQLAGFLLGFEVDAIVSSPYRRALQTIEPFAKRTGLPIQQEPRLRERLLAEGPLDDWLVHIQRSFLDLGYCVPTGESGGAAQARGLAVLAGLAAEKHQRALVVTHGNLFTLTLKAFDPTIGFEFWQALDNPDVFLLTAIEADAWSFERVWQREGAA